MEIINVDHSNHLVMVEIMVGGGKGSREREIIANERTSRSCNVKALKSYVAWRLLV